jgi:hypothetical protein
MVNGKIEDIPEDDEEAPKDDIEAGNNSCCGCFSSGGREMTDPVVTPGVSNETDEKTENTQVEQKPFLTTQHMEISKDDEEPQHVSHKNTVQAMATSERGNVLDTENLKMTELEGKSK